MCGFWVSDHSNTLLQPHTNSGTLDPQVPQLGRQLKLVPRFFVWFCRFNMNKALRLSVVWQTMLFALLFGVTGYLYYGASVTAAVYCAPITIQNSTADTPPLHLGPDTEGALHHVA